MTYQDDVALALRAAATYYGGEDSPLTDFEYDALVARIEAHEAEHPEDFISHGLHDEVAAGTQSGDVPHPKPMLSLNKVRDLGELDIFLERVREASLLGEYFSDVSVQPKLDGMAVRAVYRGGELVQVVTRGDGAKGEDVTARVLRQQVTISGLPRTLNLAPGDPQADFEVRGELLMSHDDFVVSNANRQAAGKPGFANPRNATAGSVRAETLEYDVDLSFITYEPGGTAGLFEQHFIFAAALLPYSTFGADHYDKVAPRVEEFGKERAEFAYPTDGVVIKVDDPTLRARMGTGSRAPKWAKAYKYEAQSGESVVRDILVEVGRTGNLSFTAVFDPVLVDGSTISFASVHNVDYIAEKDIRIGSKVTVYKANDIIPQILSATNGEDTEAWTPPTHDAEGFPYERRGKFLVSTNPNDSVAAAIAYAGSRDVLDIDGLGRESAVALVEAELVRTGTALSDLFRLTEANLVAVLGKNGSKLFMNISNAKAQPLNRVITALGVRLTGRTFGRRLAAAFGSLAALRDATVTELLGVEGIGDERARVIHAGLQERRDMIDALIDVGVTATADKPAGGVLDGLAVVVTGAMTGPLAGIGRTQVQELIERHGGRASSSVSKSTALLVCGEEGSSKWTKAKSLGVRIVTPEEFAEMVGL